ncbi:PRTRC system protein B [uncultured Alistipes sp.]|uniref:PRTRC system protein B n=1 Tax=uncultured Alistipes sp. TaxID=538949 RepID=UPI00272BBA9A|nr:PRTRC system protein B [uncultured Alistipes sp.]
MNELTRKLTTCLRPQAALIAYSSLDDRHDKDYFLELRAIDKEGIMGEAQPVTCEFMNEIAHSYTASRSSFPHGAIPRNMLYADVRRGSERYVWYDLPQRRMMYFHGALQIENAEYNLPGVIYEVVNDDLKIYAYKGAEPPTAATELFRAPFFNVSGAGVCLGSAQSEMPKNGTFSELTACWERRFWLSEFTHLGSGGNPTHSNLVLVTKAARNAPFDSEELIPMKMQLKNLL